MDFATETEERAEARLTVFRSLFEGSGVDPVTLWWVVQAASALPRPTSGGTYTSVLGLIEMLCAVRAASGSRPLASPAGLSSKQ